MRKQVYKKSDLQNGRKRPHALFALSKLHRGFFFLRLRIFFYVLISYLYFLRAPGQIPGGEIHARSIFFSPLELAKLDLKKYGHFTGQPNYKFQN